MEELYRGILRLTSASEAHEHQLTKDAQNLAQTQTMLHGALNTLRQEFERTRGLNEEPLARANGKIREALESMRAQDCAMCQRLQSVMGLFD